MKRYHYIDEKGNISDALPLAAIHMIGLPPTTLVLAEGATQWIKLGEIAETKSPTLPAAILPPPPKPPPPPSPTPLRSTTPPPPPIAAAPSPLQLLPTTAAADKKPRKGCRGILGGCFTIALTIAVGFITVCAGLIVLFGPDKPKEEKPQTSVPPPAAVAPPAKSEQAKQEEVAEVKAMTEWLASGRWECVDADTALMKGANLDFGMDSLKITYGGDELVTRSYKVLEVGKASPLLNKVERTAKIQFEANKETLLKFHSEGGFDTAGLTWNKGRATLSLVRRTPSELQTESPNSGQARIGDRAGAEKWLRERINRTVDGKIIGQISWFGASENPPLMPFNGMMLTPRAGVVQFNGYITVKNGQWELADFKIGQ